MSRYTPPSIDSFGGISPYLDETKDEHNGYGSKDLVKNWRWGIGKHMNITGLAVLFGVSWPTMDGWIDRLHAEAGKPRPDKKVPNETAKPE